MAKKKIKSKKISRQAKKERNKTKKIDQKKKERLLVPSVPEEVMKVGAKSHFHSEEKKIYNRKKEKKKWRAECELIE